MTDESDVIQLGGEVIDLAGGREPTLVDVVCSSAVRRAAARALRELESHHGHAPWIVICTTTSELVAASPSFDPAESPPWMERVSRGLQLETGAVPLAILGLAAPDDWSVDHPAVVAAHQ